MLYPQKTSEILFYLYVLCQTLSFGTGSEFWWQLFSLFLCLFVQSAHQFLHLFSTIHQVLPLYELNLALAFIQFGFFSLFFLLSFLKLFLFFSSNYCFLLNELLLLIWLGILCYFHYSSYLFLGVNVSLQLLVAFFVNMKMLSKTKVVALGCCARSQSSIQKSRSRTIFVLGAFLRSSCISVSSLLYLPPFRWSLNIFFVTTTNDPNINSRTSFVIGSQVGSSSISFSQHTTFSVWHHQTRQVHQSALEWNLEPILQNTPNSRCMVSCTHVHETYIFSPQRTCNKLVNQPQGPAPS